MDIIQIVLLAAVTFLFAIDQFSLTELLYRPIVACPIIGLILGDLQIGLVLGGTYELMLVGNMPVGGAQPPNAVLGSIVAMVFAVKSGMSIEEALGASMIFAVFGQQAINFTFTLMAGLMAWADKSAENADPKGIRNVNLTSMVILGTLFAALSVAAYVGGASISGFLEGIQKDASWVLAGLGAAGGMMKFVGFAILLKIMMSNDLWGFFLAGFAGATVIGKIPLAWAVDAETGAVTSASTLSGVTMLLIAFIGIAIAFYDYQTNVSIKKQLGNGGVAGGGSDGI